VTTSSEPLGGGAGGSQPKLSRARGIRTSRGDFTFRWWTVGCALLIAALMLVITIILVRGSMPSIKEYGFSFLWHSVWNVPKNQYGALGPIVGTLTTTAIAMVIALPLALVIALLLVELVHPAVARILGTAVEMLAAIPSIIYGLWGFFVLVPLMQKILPWIQGTWLGKIPGLFTGPPMGIGILTAGIILAFMVLPFITAVSRDVLQMVPKVTKEAGFGMGATTWEVTRKISLRYGFGGFVGAFFIGLGRAFGETMAVLFVIGAVFQPLPKSLIYPGVTFASAIASQFNESQGLQKAALLELGLVLFLVTICFQLVAQLWLRWVNKRVGTR
jgi:phosphate transport system permease protein